tara:strand:- start:962 stop:1159 length:198 start_codon:yes stop_codon:yes gene_type:complete
MDSLPSKLKSLKDKARDALDSDESVEDVALAVYYDLFVYRGMDTEERQWCKEVAARLMQELVDEE